MCTYQPTHPATPNLNVHSCTNIPLGSGRSWTRFTPFPTPKKCHLNVKRISFVNLQNNCMLEYNFVNSKQSFESYNTFILIKNRNSSFLFSNFQFIFWVFFYLSIWIYSLFFSFSLKVFFIVTPHIKRHIMDKHYTVIAGHRGPVVWCVMY